MDKSIEDFAKLNGITYEQAIEILEEDRAKQDAEMQEVYEDIIRSSH